MNSAHHQGVDAPGQGIVYVQWAFDGVVEALAHRFLPVLGVQWHPERLCFGLKAEGMAEGVQILGYFLEGA